MLRPLSVHVVHFIINRILILFVRKLFASIVGYASTNISKLISKIINVYNARMSRLMPGVSFTLHSWTCIDKMRFIMRSRSMYVIIIERYRIRILVDKSEILHVSRTVSSWLVQKCRAKIMPMFLILFFSFEFLSPRLLQPLVEILESHVWHDHRVYSDP